MTCLSNGNEHGSGRKRKDVDGDGDDCTLFLKGGFNQLIREMAPQERRILIGERENEW